VFDTLQDRLVAAFKSLRGKERDRKASEAAITSSRSFQQSWPRRPCAEAAAGSSRYGAGMSDFMDKAKDLADEHDEQVDQGLDKAGDVADERTGTQYGEHIDKGVDFAQERTGSGDTTPDKP
jgi:MT0933-like antitoxin protein